MERMDRLEHTTHLTNRWTFALRLGIFAGLIWGAVKIVFYYLGFTKVIPGFMVEPFYQHAFLNSWKGHMVGWFYFIVISIIATYIYILFFYKIKGPWMGMVYGLLWWCFFYLIIGPLNAMMPRIDKLDWNTIITDFCLFILWGLFIGYTIAVEFTDERMREYHDEDSNQ